MTGARLTAACKRCGLSVDTPAHSALGPYVVAAFRDEHAGHDDPTSDPEATR